MNTRKDDSPEIPIKKEYEIELKPCNKSDSWWASAHIRPTLSVETLKCADLSHVRLTGDYFSKNFVTVAFGVKRCIKDPTNNCATNKTEIDEFFDGKKLSIFHTNTHSITAHKPETLITTVAEDIFEELSIKQTNEMNIFLGKQHLKYNDMFWAKEKESFFLYKIDRY